MAENYNASYEELPYTNNAFLASHPAKLATVATLHGLTPPPLEDCRVLELGCGRGGNLLPMAEAMPAGQFVGVDLSPRQIDEADVCRDALSLTNIQFHAMDIVDVGDRLGKFDFVLAHGVYSWVPPHVQEAMLRLCADSLSVAGITYISYNTYPGWHYRGVVRDLLKQHVSRDAPPREQVEQARRVLNMVIQAMPDQEGIRTRLVIDECSALLRQADGYIYHDQLESNNHPCYFRDFAARAGKHGLQYIAEAQVNPLIESIAPQVRRAARETVGADHVQFEQLTDFLVHRTFRRSLLCHTGREPAVAHQAERLRGCFVNSLSHPSEEPIDLASTSSLTFQTLAGDSMTTAHPLVKTALATLHERRPIAVPFEEFAEQVGGRLGHQPGTAYHSELLSVLLAAYLRGAVGISLSAARFCQHVTNHPVASPIARWQAAGDSRVTSREHRSLDLDAVDRILLRHMDGTRDREALRGVLGRAWQDGELQIEGLHGLLGESDRLSFLGRLFDRRAAYLAENGFLIG